MISSIAAWTGFTVTVTFFILLDLVVISKFIKKINFKVSSILIGCWIAVALLFAGVIFFFEGTERALLFVTGYVIELALSMDNVFVFILIFSTLNIPAQFQHKVLFIGILSAIFMRLGMINVGIYLVNQFQWVFYIFGAFLIYSGFKAFKESLSNEEEGPKGENKLMSKLRKYLNITPKLHGQEFFVQLNGKLFFTPLFIALILIEQADLVFALDSVPAVLAITDDLFIVFTSNIFAILGLRSMYFMLSNVVSKFVYFKYALAFLLTYIGAKMVASVQGVHIPIGVSLSIITLSIGLAVSASLIKVAHQKNKQ